MNDKIVEFIRKIEDTVYFQYIHTIGTLFSGVLSVAKEMGDTEAEEYLKYEIEAMRLHVKSPFIFPYADYKRRFDGSFFEIDKLPKQQVEYYEKRLLSSNNVFLRSRYADVLFDYNGKHCKTSKYEIGKLLVQLLHETANKHLLNNSNTYLEYYEDISRAIEVCLKMKLSDQLIIIITELFELLDKLIKLDRRWTLEISRLFLAINDSPMKSLLAKDIVDSIIDKLKGVKDHLWDNKQHDLHRLFCDELIDWSRITKLDEGIINSYQNEIGMSFEAEAIHQQGRGDKSNLVKAHFYECALKHYKDIGNTSKIDEMKTKIKESYTQAVTDGEFKEHKFQFDMPEAYALEKQKHLEFYRQHSLKEFFYILALDVNLIPNLNNIKKFTENQKGKFVFAEIMPACLISDGKKVFQPTSDEESFEMRVDNNYMMHVQLIQEFSLIPIFELAINEKGMSAESILQKLKEWELLNENNYKLIEIGIRRFFDDDYISALHILVPQIEAVIRNMFAMAGFSTTSIKSNVVVTQHEETFNAFLEREEIKNALGENFLKFLQFVLVEQTGYNLRNIIAHGLIASEACDRRTVILMLYILIKLTSFHLVENNGTEQTT